MTDLSNVSKFRAGLASDLALIGHHVQLEPLSSDHVADLTAAAADGELWNLHYTGVPTPDQMPAMVKNALCNRDAGIEHPFVVRRLSDNRVVGSTRYYYLSEQDRNLSIGFTWYSASVHRTGVNTECKLLLLQHAFETMGCIAVHWHTHHDNVRSQKAIQRLGAKFDGIIRNHKIMPNGTIRHTHCFSMIDSEWPQSKAFLTGRLAAFSDS
ncbi:N-acetyltransferase [Arenicella chitinivorans]|uniref:N-acetyltransferase n=1 Tax=Arenicella chitinivorans TaxID=1329800 RepID=A0A918S0Z8_9GAMM|nr:GNAT family N-acetyltransferase [Arenicella chitinivorans]GHA16837.1 N-acetyltransferase [Arenicella chitinivorans]